MTKVWTISYLEIISAKQKITLVLLNLVLLKFLQHGD